MTSSSSLPTSSWSQASRLWDQLTEPSRLITDDPERLRARLLASMALVSLFGSLISNLIVLIYPQPLPVTVLSLASTALVILLYALSRSRYLRAGLILSTIGSFAIMYVTVLASPQPAYSAIALLIPLTLAALFWPPRIMGVLALTGMLLAASVIGFEPQNAALLILTLVYLSLSTLGVTLITVLRQRDQSQLAQRAAALERSENRYRDLFDRSPIALWEVDFSDVLKSLQTRFGDSSAGLRARFSAHPEEMITCLAEFRVLAVNQMTLRLFGVDSLPALFEALAIQTAAVELSTALDMLLSVAERQPAFEADILQYRIGDRMYDLHVRWIVLPGHEPDLSRVIISVEDITARRQAERDRLELELERERGALLRRFVGDVSHDLVTPITVLKTTLYLLARTPSPARQRERLRSVETQVDNLERMIENLLTMLRLDQVPEDGFAFAEQDINPLVGNLVTAYQPLAASRSQTLVFESGTGAQTVRLDADQFKRAVANLLENALKFTPAGGRVEVSLTASAGEAILEVRDTGPGIPAEELRHIFERFYRGAQHRPIGSGMGLGLAIARRIVETHSGRIEAESVVGQGSVFRVRLPLTAD